MKRRYGMVVLMLSCRLACAGGLVNIGIRREAREFYRDGFVTVEPFLGWTGSYAATNAGGTAADFRDAVIAQVNYFRGQAGFLPVTEADSSSLKSQQAAFMMSLNGMLSHAPTPDWAGYTPDGAEAAAKSCLCLGVNGITAIAGYMDDPGAGNAMVGHRNWMLRPETTQMGTGDVPGGAGRAKANALWVVTYEYDPREMRDARIAWPPADGYTPYQVVYPRWSFKLDGADLSAAQVSMQSEAGTNISLTVEHRPTDAWYPLVWTPEIPASSYYAPRDPPASDEWYRVSISNITVDGASTAIAYTVVVFDPDCLAEDDGGPKMAMALGSQGARVSWKTPCQTLWKLQTATQFPEWQDDTNGFSYDGVRCSIWKATAADHLFFRLKERE